MTTGISAAVWLLCIMVAWSFAWLGLASVASVPGFLIACVVMAVAPWLAGAAELLSVWGAKLAASPPTKADGDGDQ